MREDILENDKPVEYYISGKKYYEKFFLKEIFKVKKFLLENFRGEKIIVGK